MSRGPSAPRKATSARRNTTETATLARNVFGNSRPRSSQERERSDPLSRGRTSTERRPVDCVLPASLDFENTNVLLILSMIHHLSAADAQHTWKDV